MPALLALDHIAVAAPTLEAGNAHVADALGVAPHPGGAHPAMGTHNSLLRLGDDLYLEVIAIDPAATAPQRPRWFGLDTLGDAPPRLLTWLLRTTDIGKAISECPVYPGPATPMTRGSLSWRISVREDGTLPMAGAWPSLIEWEAEPHPAAGLPDDGLALRGLTVVHPEVERIAEHLLDRFDDLRVHFRQGERIRLSAEIDTPQGPRILG